MTQPGWRALLVLEQALVDLERDIHRDSAMTDELAGQLEQRVAQLEELLFARWPRSVAVRRRLRRDLRASVRHVQGATFGEKRLNSVSTGWLERPL